MRVAQLTFDGYFNYGNNLQKYALQHTLKKFVDFVEDLWTDNTSPFHDMGAWGFVPNATGIDERMAQRYIPYEIVRTAKIKEFENRYIKTRFDIPYLEDTADEYDYFVAGSDQIWQPACIEPKYFLDFAPSHKKIAYAASIANPKIPDELKEFYKFELMTFPKISVREEGAIKIIQELTGRDDVELVLDPVMLLTKNEWLEIAQKPSWFNEKYENGYVLTYYLRTTPPHSVINEIANELGLPVINLLDMKNYWHYVTSPEEFVYLFANANFVITHSFHGTAFSILFRKPFIYADIVGDNSAKGMSLRIEGISKMFGLESRVTSEENNYEIKNPLEIDWTVRDESLFNWRLKSFKFLSKSLNVPIPEKFLIQ